MAQVKTVTGSSRVGRVIKARLVEASGDREAALKLRVRFENGETIDMYDAFREERKVGKLPYEKFLCKAFNVTDVDDLAEAIEKSEDEFLCKQVIYPMKGDNGKELHDDDGEVIMSDPHWRIELVF